MKPILLCILLFGHTVVFSQQLDPGQITADRYFQKSRNQKTGAWLLTIAGSAGLLATLASNLSHETSSAATAVFSLGTVQSEQKSYTVPYILSAACIAGGVALFSTSSMNRNKANGLMAYFKMERAPMLLRYTKTEVSYPSVAFRIKL